jgi:hypothetical protein
MSKGLGKNQKIILPILQELTKASGNEFNCYNGGDRMPPKYSPFRRTISIGRNKKKYRNVPNYVIDLREAYDQFKHHHPNPLSSDCSKTFNRAIQSLILRDYITPLSYYNVTDKNYFNINHARYKEAWQQKRMGNIRFITLNVLYAQTN